MTDDILTLKLKKSLKTKADDEITSLVLREPTAGEWRAFDGLEGVDADIMAVSKVTRLPVDVVEQMAASDLVAASAWMARFFRPARATGKS